jgi:branched-chain amino acid transport system permease protein
MLVLGGMGSVSGSVIGAVSITILSELLRNAERGIDFGIMRLPPIYGASQIIMAISFILVIIFYPKGLLGTKEIDFNAFWSKLLEQWRGGKQPTRKEV